jgi:hypothetical protein
MLPGGDDSYGQRMDTPIGFLDCPAWLDAHGASRCGLPAEVRFRYTATSTDGPVNCAMIRCPVGHWFNAPTEVLSPENVITRTCEETR